MPDSNKKISAIRMKDLKDDLHSSTNAHEADLNTSNNNNVNSTAFCHYVSSYQPAHPINARETNLQCPKNMGAISCEKRHSDSSLISANDQRCQQMTPTPTTSSSSHATFIDEHKHDRVYFIITEYFCEALTVAIWLVYYFLDGSLLWAWLFRILVIVVIIKWSIYSFFPYDDSFNNRLSGDLSPNHEKLIDTQQARIVLDDYSNKNVLYQGLMNYLPCNYDVITHSINDVKPVLVRLEKNVIRIAVCKTHIPKHDFHTQPQYEPSFLSQEVFDMSGAKVVLRPEGLARRRWFSRKYPICICLKSSVSNSCDFLNETATNKFKKNSKTTSFDKPKVYQSASMPQLNEGFDSMIRKAKKSKSKNAIAKDNDRPSRILYLFGRNAREKEHWFYRLKIAAGLFSSNLSCSQSIGNLSQDIDVPEHQFLENVKYLNGWQQFFRSMKIAGLSEPVTNSSGYLLYNMMLSHRFRDVLDKSIPELSVGSSHVSLFNGFLTRIFLECSKDPFWIKAVHSKIEAKLSTIRPPAEVIETLKLIDLNVGARPPLITSIYKPTYDEWGLWVDFEIDYFGGFSLALETKLNANKLKAARVRPAHKEAATLLQYMDEAIPDSPESSEDEKVSPSSSPKGKKKGKLRSAIDYVVNSSSFQKLTNGPSFQKLFKDISDIRLAFIVDLEYLQGRLTINIPPPPSDRLWYGFRSRPSIKLKPRCYIGQRSVNINWIIELIENRLYQAFEKNFVIPNMDDMSVPLTAGSPLLKDIHR